MIPLAGRVDGKKMYLFINLFETKIKYTHAGTYTPSNTVGKNDFVCAFLGSRLPWI